MGRYQCYYRSGRQFIFTERPRWVLAGLIGVALGGLLIGFCIAVTISFTGFLLFELAMLAGTLVIAYEGFRLTSGDVLSQCLFLLATLGTLGLLLVAGHCSPQLDMNTPDRCILFSAGGFIIGFILYGYMLLCLQEDERKHHLDLCGPDGDVLGPLEPDEVPVEVEGGWQTLARFVVWVLSWQWWLDCNASIGSAGEESDSCEITVYNRTLKIIKVCFYSPDDMLCWVPFGGISGRCVGRIRAEGSRTFILPRRTSVGSQAASGHYTLKIFEPSVLDVELARYLKAQGGQSFAFFDVERMVKLSRVLSSARVSPKHLMQSDTSDEDLTGASPLATLDLNRGLARQPRAGGSICTLKRNASGEGSPARPAVLRKAGHDEVVVRNRSVQEIRALLFRADDYCFMVPLVGKLTTCGDCILPNTERRFTPHTTDQDFTLKVYSVGAGARELTYFTVSRGHTYTFCDSLLS